ncbi:hypothetical protein OSB04_031781 [Centaurea solstitialis]|uniref:Uncharacterized protein n=1 Tax=Centaurea solstitialis TaxID=347529 RepID=A0AA38SVB4_9ASTR|nr:hypothetical protein OSB04_031781 [Centaurea solstitialis]
MSRMLLSSSCLLVFLLCLSHESNGRHLSSVDEHAKDDNSKLLPHSTIKGFKNDPLTVHTDLNLKANEMETIGAHNDNHKQTDCKSHEKKDMIKGQKVKEDVVHGHHHQRPQSLATVTFRVPPKNKRVHQQPGFNLDYSPPKTHPPSHN